MYTKILVPLDGSKTAEMVLPNVVRLARESKSKVVLLTVDAPSLDSRKTGPSWSNMGDALATLERPDAQMKAYMDSAAGMLAGMGSRPRPSRSLARPRKRYWPMPRTTAAT